MLDSSGALIGLAILAVLWIVIIHEFVTDSEFRGKMIGFAVLISLIVLLGMADCSGTSVAPNPPRHL